DGQVSQMRDTANKLRDSSASPQNDNDFKNIFIVGDGAATAHSGMAKTAWYDGRYAADSIRNLLKGQKQKVYTSSAPWHFLPAGREWVAVMIGKFQVFGILGWYIRRFIDFLFLFKYYPLEKPLMLFARINYCGKSAQSAGRNDSMIGKVIKLIFVSGLF